MHKMKMINARTFFAAAVAGSLVCGPLAFGQDATASPSAASTEAPEHPGKKHHFGERLEMLSQKLGLSEAQKDQLRPIFKSEFEQIKAVRDDSTLTQDQKREKIRAIHKETKPKIDAVLTPEQIQKMKELREEHREHHEDGEKPVTTGT